MLGSHCQHSAQHGSHAEGRVARAIEQETAKLPSDLFLWAAVGTLGLSCGLHAAGRKHLSLFIGQWASPLLIMGLYNKLVKVAGSDRYSRREEDDREHFDHEAAAETVVDDRTHLDDDRYEVEQPQAEDRSDHQPQYVPHHENDGAAYREHAENEFGPQETPIGSSTDTHLPPTYDPQAEHPIETRFNS